MPTDNGFIIARMAKLGSKSKLAHNVKHALREIYVKGAHPERLRENVINGPKTYAEFQEKLAAHMAGVYKFRSDSPEVIEIFCGASPEFFKNGGDEKAFFNAAHQYFCNLFGPENILLSAVHRDEATPHLSMFVCPIRKNPAVEIYEAQVAGKPLPPRPRADGKPRKRTQKFTERPPEKIVLASHYISDASSLSQFQGHIWRKVGQQFGLKRGVQGSKAKHVDPNAWKAAMERVTDLRVPKFNIPQLTVADRMNPTAWAEKMRDAVMKVATQALRDAALAVADAKLKIQKLNQTTARLQAWELSLSKQQAEFTEQVNYTAEGIARAALAGVKAELDAYRNNTTADLVPVLTAQLATANEERTAALRALARNIKATTSDHDMSRLSLVLGVPKAKGKADIFERLMKSGAAPTFEQAVLMVDAQILMMQADDQAAPQRAAEKRAAAQRIEEPEEAMAMAA